MQNTESFQVSVKVNGHELTMNLFVQEMVKNVAFALVSSLKIPDKPQTIEITLRSVK
ncbi:MAG: hypothetical protein ONB13_03670 [candidate division KSB1 bacterium]|nr:hypothetical protein [candidate division KSB1 bacterium]MDZ7334998.1 hypothetical protein [candidate division KSB1 bacterium]MDZ7357125.1 hypothetical protein [candidate division KSB1 bacterium]MDZ7375698.1 hypothetical protein [candidate division KSB1 bacterium]MDZ7400193.1 hypothetical protein [candidate division KSB1 bacterium]